MHKSNKLFSVAMICVVAGLFFFAAVPSSPANSAMPGIQLLLLSGKNIVEVTGDITTNTTWKNSNIYLIRAYDFWVEATLTIEPGTIVKFHPADGPYMVLGSGGKILANGTAAHRLFLLRTKMMPTAATRTGTAVRRLRPQATGMKLRPMANRTRNSAIVTFITAAGELLT